MLALQPCVHMQFRVATLMSFDSVKGFFRLMCGLRAPKLKMSFHRIFKDEITGSCQAVLPNNEKQHGFESK